MTTKERLRYERRKSAVLAVKRGEPVNTVSRVMKVSRSALFGWLSKYGQSGLEGLKERKKSGRPSKLSKEHVKWLYDVITGGVPRQRNLPFALWTLKNIRVMLYKAFKIKLHKSTLSRLLRRIGITPQKPVYKAYNQDEAKAQKWTERDFPRIRRAAQKGGWKIFFIDEAALRSDHHRGTTWGKRGQTPVVFEHRGRHGINMISAVNPQGQLWFDAYSGRMNSEKFCNFLEKMLQDIEGKLLIIADRAKYHTSKETRGFVKAKKERLRLFYLPTYSPELNPDEQVWNRAKSILGKQIIENKEEMKIKALRVLQSLQKKAKLIASFFRLPDTQYILN